MRKPFQLFACIFELCLLKKITIYFNADKSVEISSHSQLQLFPQSPPTVYSETDFQWTKMNMQMPRLKPVDHCII